MDLTDIGYVKKLLSSHGFAFSKSLGQNFLIDSSVCPRMAEIAEAKKGTGIIEIGTGIGTLTYQLAKRAEKVVTFEVDKKLYPIIESTLSEFNNVELMQHDILKTDLKKVADEYFNGMEIAVCANLPYYITSPIIMYLLESNIEWKSITLMIQKEAADRICAEEGSRNTGAITFAVRYYGKAERCFDVPSTSFMPPPKVNSSVIKITPDSYVKDNVKNMQTYFKIVRAGFAQRRKLFVNSVSSGTGVKKETIACILNELSIKENIRAEQMTLEEFISFANKFEEYEIK